MRFPSAGLFSCGLLLVGAGVSRAAEPVSHSKLSYDQSVALSARWDLGYYLFQNQDYGGAVREFEKLRAVMPKDPTLLALIGSCYSMSGKWADGEKALLESRAQNPEDADVNGLLGQFYLSLRQPLKGAVYLEHALKLSPELEDLRIKLVDVYLSSGQLMKARAHLETLLSERGGEFGDPDLDHAYADCLVRSGHYKEALKHATAAAQAEPQNPRYARTLGLDLLGLNRFGEAAKLISSSRPWLDGDAGLFLQLGEALFQDRHWAEAENAWLDGMRKFPDSYALLSRLLEYYVSAAQPQRAERVLAFARMQNPGNAGNLLLEARLGRKLGRYSAAGMALDRLKRMACGRLAEEALWEEAQLDFETGKLTACGKALQRIPSGSDRGAEARLLKAKLALRSGDGMAAKRLVLEARDANPYDLKVYALAREAFRAEGDRGALDGMLRDAQALLAGSGAYALLQPTP